jgi:hypothetical protein
MFAKRLSILFALLTTTLGITAHKYISLKDGSIVNEIREESCVRNIQYVADVVLFSYDIKYV